MAPKSLIAALAAAAALAACGKKPAPAQSPVAARPAAARPAATPRSAAPTAQPVVAHPAAPAPVQLAMAGAAAPDLSVAPMGALRESFAYTGGARDPFLSLISLKSAGPDLADLNLVGIYYNERAPSASIAIMTEKNGGKRHKLRLGDKVGRATLASIRPKDITFQIADFGFERQQTFTLRKQEDSTP